MQVFQYDTDQNCLEPPMAIFSLLALLTVLLFVIPIPILVLLASKRRFSIWILKVNTILYLNGIRVKLILLCFFLIYIIANQLVS